MEKSRELYKTSTDFVELRRIAKNAKRFVLICNNAECTKNYVTNTTSWIRNDEYEWLIDMVCTKCNGQWSVCFECANVRTAFTTDNQIKQHRYTYHNPRRPNKRKISIILEKSTVVPVVDETFNISDQVRDHPPSNRHHTLLPADDHCSNVAPSGSECIANSLKESDRQDHSSMQNS